MLTEVEKEKIISNVALELSELKKLGVRVVELTEERKATAVEFYEGGMKVSEIVDALLSGC